MATKAGQLKDRADDYQAYILEMFEEDNGYQVRPSQLTILATARMWICCSPF